jgi:peptidoglycan/LPS O-acetylase OafA/YrhL
MIQRIQTIWLLLAAICMALTLKYAFYSGYVLDNGKEVYKEVNSSSNILNLLVAIAFVAGAVITIFLFKKSSLQIKITIALILLGLANLFLLWNGTKLHIKGNYGIAAILPIFAVGFSISALRGIWADRKKIQELNSNRLR